MVASLFFNFSTKNDTARKIIRHFFRTWVVSITLVINYNDPVVQESNDPYENLNILFSLTLEYLL